MTKACLRCHTEAAKQVHRSTHWTWEFQNDKTGQRLGKKYVVNSFCGSLTSNYARCTSCHVGFGWKDDSFDFDSETNVDCMVCHDTTGEYVKFPTAAGHPPYQDTKFMGKVVKAPDLAKVARRGVADAGCIADALRIVLHRLAERHPVDLLGEPAPVELRVKPESLEPDLARGEQRQQPRLEPVSLYHGRRVRTP